MCPGLLERLTIILFLDLHMKLITQWNHKQDHLFALNFKLQYSRPLTCMNKHSA